MFRRTILVFLLALAPLAACGDDDSSDAADQSTTTADAADDAPDELTGDPAVLDDVEVSGDEGSQPTLDFPTPFSVDDSARKIIDEGSGDAVGDGTTAIFDFVLVNGRDGSIYATTWTADGTADGPTEGAQPAQAAIDDTLLRGIRLGLDGVQGGGRVLVAIAPEDAFGPGGGDPENGLEADDTLLLLADVREVRTPLERAEGTPVEPADGLPTVTLDDTGAPTIEVPDTDPPDELVVQPLIEGDGPVVETGQTLTVHYTGVLWDTGEVFDSSWESGAPASFPIGTGGVIPGWDKGLVGVTVGSQILLVVPPADGYPDGNGAIPAGSTLVFVVDILDAG